MNLSISQSGKNIWVWMFWGLLFFLVLELGPFFLAWWVFKKTAAELAGPYMAFAIPSVIIMPLIWWLRRWEEQGASPKRVARGWGLSGALFITALSAAVFYSGVKLYLISPSDAILSFAVAAFWGGCIAYFTMYHTVSKTISSRTARNSER